MQIPVRSIASYLTALALASAAACSVDKAGLGQFADAATGAGGSALAGHAGTNGQAGAPGSSGASGSISGTAGSVAGTPGTAGAHLSGIAGDDGAAGAGGVPTSAGSAGQGDQGGEGGNTGLGGVPGEAGTTGAGGQAGTPGDAGESGMAGGAGTAGMAGGGAGSTGRGGFFGGRGGRGGGGAGGSGPCPTGCAACFRCGVMGCEPTPDAVWTFTCVSATISSTKPNGNTWDTGNGETGPPPDALCQLTVDNRSRSSSIVTDSLTPSWNANVTPTGGMALTTMLLTSPDERWKLVVYDQDIVGSSTINEAVCTITAQLTAADLAKGSVTFTNVDSCKQVAVSLQCTAGTSN